MMVSLSATILLVHLEGLECIVRQSRVSRRLIKNE
jgi:hypothetical protein